MVTATLLVPLNVNDAVTSVPEQPCALAWYGGCSTVARVAFSVGLLGLITVPLAMPATTVPDGACIAVAPMVMSNGADQFEQCGVGVALGVREGSVRVALTREVVNSLDGEVVNDELGEQEV